MDDRPGAIQPDPKVPQERESTEARAVGDPKRKSFVLSMAAYGSHQIKLAADLVAYHTVGFGVRRPVRKQLIRILPTMRQPERNIREVAEKSRS
jgi:hypothetical protein